MEMGKKLKETHKTVPFENKSGKLKKVGLATMLFSIIAGCSFPNLPGKKNSFVIGESEKSRDILDFQRKINYSHLDSGLKKIHSNQQMDFGLQNISYSKCDFECRKKQLFKFKKLLRDRKETVYVPVKLNESDQKTYYVQNPRLARIVLNKLSNGFISGVAEAYFWRNMFSLKKSIANNFSKMVQHAFNKKNSTKCEKTRVYKKTFKPYSLFNLFKDEKKLNKKYSEMKCVVKPINGINFLEQAYKKFSKYISVAGFTRQTENLLLYLKVPYVPYN